jgi:signal transduction histidine kinase
MVRNVGISRTKHIRNSHPVVPFASSSILDEVGFRSAARWYTDEFAKRSGIQVKLELPDSVDRGLPESVRIALFRILQESLTNVHRHSGSPAVEIRLKPSNHQAVFTVRDFGRGVPAELTQVSQTDGEHFGVGLSGMRERVNDLGGTFEIHAEPLCINFFQIVPW